MTIMDLNPTALHAFEAAVKASVQSHLESMTEEQPILEQKKWSTPEKPDSSVKDVAPPPDVKDNTSNVWTENTSTSSSITKPFWKMRRLRNTSPRTISMKNFFGGQIIIQTDTYQVMKNLCGDRETADSDDVLEHEVVFRYHPAKWLLRKGFNFGICALVMKAAQVWRYQI